MSSAPGGKMSSAFIWKRALDVIADYACERGLQIEYTKATVDDEVGWWMQLGDSPEAKRFYPDSYWDIDESFSVLATARRLDVEKWIDEVVDYAARAVEPEASNAG